MKIRVLVDNNTLIDRYFVGEPAVCYYIEMDGMRILFDTGYSDVFLKNAGAMGMDMKDITHIVLSHGHNDHTGGLAHVCADCMGIQHPRPDIRLVAHPGCFEPKVCDGEDIGSPWGRNVAETCFSYIPAVKPWFLSENCVFLGQIPRKNGFEGRDAIGVRKPWDGGYADAGGQGKPCVNGQIEDGWQQDTLEDDSAHPQLDEIIFSGGDPLMAKDHELDWLLTQLESIPHIKRLRIHSRLPIVIPARITDTLVARIAASSLKVLLVNHVNHANEIDAAFRTSMRKLRMAGVTLLNQSVLLRGVNDNANTLADLSNALFDAGVMPYYLHVLDKVQGAAHFMVSDEEARAIVRELLTLVSGYLVPKLAREIGGEPSKTPLDLGLKQQ